MSIPGSLAKLRNLETNHLELAKNLTGALFMLDFLAGTVLNRSLCLVSGFASLIEQRNFVAAAPFLRIQLDNVLRFYASSLVADPNEFAKAVMEGNQVRKMKDKTGQKLTDAYLVQKFVTDPRFTIERSWVSSVYDQTSGYMHLSEKHISNCVEFKEGGSFRMKISAVDEYVPEWAYLEAIDGMAEATSLTLEFIFYWTQTRHC